MGVTLERVQNKFACIIGELCSEPDILSEFAIWLDLRLAEYKAKGAIQLECSGEMPDPSWLRGHKKPPKRIKTQREMIQHYDSSPQYNVDIPHEVSERLSVSPEIVVVKEERSDGTNIFPVDVYRHENSSSNINNSRKRLSNDGSSIGHLDKMPRLSPSTSVLEPVNQSLMSIISENTADDSADLTANLSADFSHLDSSNVDNSSYIPSSSYTSLPSTSRDESTNQQDGSNSELFDYHGPSEPLSESGRRGRYLNWSPMNMEKAIAVVMDGKMSRTKASETFNVPHRSLCRKIQKIKEEMTKQCS